MLTRERTTAGHTDRVLIRQTESGWEVREERDSEVVRCAKYADWHRVERALHAFDRVSAIGQLHD